MNKKQELNAYIKECIVTALIKLMGTTPFEDITITELVKLAGVGRVSFYRNFDSKKDVLEKHLATLLQEFGDEFEKVGNPSLFSELLLKHYYEHKDFYLLLYKHGLSDMIYETIRWGTKIDEAQCNLERYGKSMVAGMLFGWVDEWMRQGMPETPEELALLTNQHIEEQPK